MPIESEIRMIGNVLEHLSDAALKAIANRPKETAELAKNELLVRGILNKPKPERKPKTKLKPRSDSFVSTSLQGHVGVSYAKLVEVFGEPNAETDGYKVDAEWEFDTAYGPVTIYNYKDGKNYNGDAGMAVEDITDWHIGGTNPRVVEVILNELDRK